MKAKLIVIILLLSNALFYVYSAKRTGVSDAKLIMNSNFVSSNEAKQYLPGLPKNLPIPYSLEILKKHSDYWLIPIISARTKCGYEYRLLKPSYSFETVDSKSASQLDTLEIDAAKNAIYLLCKLRPDFLGKNKLNDEFKIFFRSKTLSTERKDYRQIFSFSPIKQKFLLIDWLDNVDSGILNYTFASFVTNINGKDFLGIIPLPDTPLVTKEKFITITTLISVKY